MQSSSTEDSTGSGGVEICTACAAAPQIPKIPVAAL
uniref:Uncharacterized protein n=1 Tax=Anguilla anguilla TaxID=7936 RepID=A0A0E9U574_ANGAN